MANIIFAERENARLHPPALKMRQRLQSAPEKLRSPMTAKTFTTPLPSGRKAFGAVNKKVSTPAVNVQEKKLLKPQETKVKQAACTKVEEYPEIEKFIPYDPLEFEKYSVPEDLIPLSGFALPGLASFPQAPHLYEEDLEKFDPLPNLSPVKMPKHSDYCSELDAFLQTLDELTVELPPEFVTDC
ncbi:securin [Larimichthys crocea]|uniref:securin n=1 Tax=Larimichthys crocea TaxID=215358 RepID=UPI000F603AD6|nr:securin-like [Larimichthys crocea]XP_027142723.1 securin-like [Larimichthys crocea]XP_027142761.1 securin-like [Larimichthys crocea]